MTTHHVKFGSQEEAVALVNKLGFNLGYQMCAGQAYNYYSSFNDEWKENILRRRYATCFGGYFSPGVTDKRRNLRFAFPMVSDWFYDAVSELNSTFKHFQIRVLDKVDYHSVIRKHDTWGDYFLHTWRVKKGLFKHSAPMMTIEFDPGYNLCAEYYMTYSLVVLIRQMSLAERFFLLTYEPLSEYKTYLEFLGDLITKRVHNGQSCYRAFAEVVLPNFTTEILNYDDIDTVNQRAEFMHRNIRTVSTLSAWRTLRQTAIYEILAQGQLNGRPVNFDYNQNLSGKEAFYKS